MRRDLPPYEYATKWVTVLPSRGPGTGLLMALGGAGGRGWVLLRVGDGAGGKNQRRLGHQGTSGDVQRERPSPPGPAHGRVCGSGLSGMSLNRG